MDSNLPPPLTAGQARIREKLARLTPDERKQALKILKQIAQHQERERIAQAASAQPANTETAEAPLTLAEQARERAKAEGSS